MGRRWTDSAVENAEYLIKRDLGQAEKRVTALIQQAQEPRTRDLRGLVRAQALMVRILAIRGNLDSALCLYEAARGEGIKNRVSKIAIAELDIKAAEVHSRAGLTSRARPILTGAQDVLQEAITASAGRQSQGSRLRLKRMQELYATSFIVSGLIALEDRDPRRAYQDALKAAETWPGSAVQISALQVLSLSALAIGNPGNLSAVLALIFEVEQRLPRSTPKIALYDLRWIRALTLERARLPAEADEVMTEVLEWYEASDYRENAMRVRTDWERIRKAARAEYQRRNPAKS